MQNSLYKRTREDENESANASHYSFKRRFFQAWSHQPAHLEDFQSMTDQPSHSASVWQIIPADKVPLLREVIAQLQAVPGVVALVLGGSYASGAQQAASDIDIGLYYDADAPFAIEAIRTIANAAGSALVSDFYEWGAWVNGGAWIHTPTGKIDFLYRNLQQVRQVLADSLNGKLELDYLQQPPYGFPNVIYLAETAICLPLYDPHHVIAELKALVNPYPPAFKNSVIQNSLWGVEFTLLFADNFAAKGDIYNTVGCLTRAANFLTQVLFALNQTYFISDKRALSTIDQFAIKPADYSASLNHLLAHPGSSGEELTTSVASLRRLWQQVVALTDGAYQPKYNL